jgi:ATP-binding cassette subfamily B protein
MRTVDGADKIVVLKNGMVAECGTPSKLKKEKGIYSHMIETQLETENWKLA